jgi:hypothetical protein
VGCLPQKKSPNRRCTADSGFLILDKRVSKGPQINGERYLPPAGPCGLSPMSMICFVFFLPGVHTKDGVGQMPTPRPIPRRHGTGPAAAGIATRIGGGWQQDPGLRRDDG